MRRSDLGFAKHNKNKVILHEMSEYLPASVSISDAMILLVLVQRFLSWRIELELKLLSRNMVG